MTYLLGGLVAATLVGIGSVLAYGPGSQIEHAWIEPAFWALIVSGALLSLFERDRKPTTLPSARAEQGA
jgi:hypothetical protein